MTKNLDNLKFVAKRKSMKKVCGYIQKNYPEGAIIHRGDALGKDYNSKTYYIFIENNSTHSNS